MLTASHKDHNTAYLQFLTPVAGDPCFPGVVPQVPGRLLSGTETDICLLNF